MDDLEMIRSKAWAWGKESFHAGVEFGRSPFPPNTPAWHDFRCGWMCGAFEFSWRMSNEQDGA